MEIFIIILVAICTYEFLMIKKLQKQVAKEKIRQLVYKSELNQIPRDYEKEEENHLMGDR